MGFLWTVIGIALVIAFFDFFVVAIKLTIKFWLAFIIISLAIKLIAKILFL
ncbi:MAG: hypothetical protein MJ115_06455 [Clostridia bacterium]|nr:hypothetical protein [Clostridia bacterium]